MFIDFIKMVTVGIGIASLWYFIMLPIAIIFKVNPDPRSSSGLPRLWFRLLFPMGIMIAYALRLLGIINI